MFAQSEHRLWKLVKVRRKKCYEDRMFQQQQKVADNPEVLNALGKVSVNLDICNRYLMRKWPLRTSAPSGT